MGAENVARTGVVVLISLVMLLPLQDVQAQVIEGVYDLYSKKTRVGSLRGTRTRVLHEGEPAVQIEAITTVRAEFLFLKYSLDTKERVLLGPEGTISYQRETKENNNHLRVVGRLEKDVFHLEIKENGKPRTMRVKKSEYDATSWDTVEDRVTKANPILRVRVLDLDALAVQVETRTYLGEAKLKVDDRVIPCRIVSFEAPGAKGRRWVAKDELGPVILKEEGEDKDGPYSFMMLSYRVISEKDRKE